MSAHEILTRTFEVPLELREGRIIEGCCVPYGEAARVRDTDDGPAYYELFEPGAFSKQLNAADKLRLRFEHRDEIFHRLGRCRALHEETSGLYATFEVYDGQFGDHALELVRHGELAGFSVGFHDRRRRPRTTPEGTVIRTDCHLHEVSLCEQPAYAGAVVTAMRSRAELAVELEIPLVDDEQLERLRNVGIRV